MSAQYEYDGEIYEFDDQEDLQAALNGDYGEEWQEAAGAVVASMRQEPAAPAGQAPPQGVEADTAAVEAELDRLEQRLGRSLTEAETNRLINTIPEEGAIPDFVEKHGDELATRRDTDEGRQAYMAEVADTMIEARKAEEAEDDAGLTPAGHRATTEAEAE